MNPCESSSRLQARAKDAITHSIDPLPHMRVWANGVSPREIHWVFLVMIHRPLPHHRHQAHPSHSPDQRKLGPSGQGVGLLRPWSARDPSQSHSQRQSHIHSHSPSQSQRQSQSQSQSHRHRNRHREGGKEREGMGRFVCAVPLVPWRLKIWEALNP